MSRTVVKINNNLASKIGYSRAVSVGNLAFVGGTTAFDNGQVPGKGDAGAQARITIKKIENALLECGFKLDHIVRTRITMARVQDLEEVAAVHHEFFSRIEPASAFYAGVQFVHPDILVEIEADAVLDHE